MSATERIFSELFQLYQKIAAFKLYKAVLELTMQSSHLLLSKKCAYSKAGDPAIYLCGHLFSDITVRRQFMLAFTASAKLI